MDEHPEPDPDSGSLPGPADDAPEGPPPYGFGDWDAYRAWVQELIDGDPGPAQEMAGFCGWLEDEDTGPDAVPAEPESNGLGISVSLGDAAGLDPALLAAMCGPDGLRGEGLGPQFGQDAPADALRPSPVLAALTEQALADGLSRLTDDELLGVLQGSVRLENREGWKQQLLIAEFARRRAAAKDAETAAAGGRVRCRAGEFPGEELAIELLIGPLTAASRIQDAQDLTGRLPATLAAMAAGLLNTHRASVIAASTHVLSDGDAAAADAVLAKFALGRRVATLARKAAALELKLAPEAVAARKERARRVFQRVEARREESGNASLSGRELGTADVLASKAHMDALAAKLRAAGVPGTLDGLRVLVFTELTQGRDPLDRINPAAAAPARGGGSGPDPAASADHPDSGGPALPPDMRPGRNPDGPAAPSDAPGGGWPRWGPGDPGYDEDHDDDSLGDAPRRDPAPFPALINFLVPVGTYLGWSTVPGEGAGWGLLDRAEIRDLIRAAATHPRTRWCATLVGPDGTAVAHACATGQHPWLADVTAPPAPPAGRHSDGPDPPQAAQLADVIRRLGLTFRPIAKGGCDHAAAEDRYTPSRKLRHLVRARTDRCDAPGCDAPAVNGDLDHTIEYPAGLTCQCNLGPKCRRHHRCKQSPGIKLEQPEPGVLRWTLPSGRVHTTTPTVYEL